MGPDARKALICLYRGNVRGAPVCQQHASRAVKKPAVGWAWSTWVVIRQLAAASAAIRWLITGRPLEGALLGAFSQALIIGTQTDGGHRVLSILSPKAARVANGVLLPEISGFGPHQAGEPVSIGDGHIRVGAMDIDVVRWWECRVPRVRPGPAVTLGLRAAVEGSARGLPAEPADELRRALKVGGTVGITAAVDGLVGLGQGLTPGGDDVLAGALTALQATGRTGLAGAIGARVEVIRDRTTLLSADLLRLAADGFGCLEMVAFLQASEAQAGRAMERLLSIGHTSGADLATGLVIGLEAS